jgi:glycosyltransferase involved in cell wall biosynthesis
MRCLFVFDRPLYPIRGGAESRAIDHLKYLESRNIKYDLFLIDRYYNYNNWDEIGIEFLIHSKVDKIYLHQVLGNKSIDTIYHKLVSRFYQFLNLEPNVASKIHALPIMINKFHKVIASTAYDFIFFNHTYISNALISNIKLDCKTYIDTHDIYSNLQKEVIDLQRQDLKIHYSGSKINLSRLKVPNFNYDLSVKKELDILGKFDNIITISNDELRIIQESHFLADKVFFVPKITALPDYNKSLSKTIGSVSFQKSKKKKFKLLFFGSQFDPNIHGINTFYYNVLPHLDFSIQLVLAGGVCKVFKHRSPLIESVGFVDDISVLYSSVDAVIIPLFYGSGVSVKAVEALSYGKPIISTPKGIRGLSVKHGKEVLIANQISDFIELINQLKQNPDLCNNLSQNAIKYIEKEHSIDNVYTIMDNIFLDA